MSGRFFQKSMLSLSLKFILSLLVMVMFAGLLSAHDAEAAKQGLKKSSNSTATALYAINIASYPEPFEKSWLPRDKSLKKYRLYTMKVRSRGKDWRALRVGFFNTEAEAKKALSTLSKKYKGAWIIKVTQGERKLAKKKVATAVKSVGSKINTASKSAGSKINTASKSAGSKIKGLAGHVGSWFSADPAKKSKAKKKSVKSVEKAASAVLYAINIASYPEPFEKSKLPRDKSLKKYRLYTIKVRSKGKDWRALRVGFFNTEAEAKKALSTLSKKYKGAWIIKASASERRLTGQKISEIGTASSKKARGVGAGFDHFRTGFPLTGGHERVRCESCHIRGLFKGTPSQCKTCHSPGGRIAASARLVIISIQRLLVTSVT